jgi:hypothetical protein
MYKLTVAAAAIAFGAVLATIPAQADHGAGAVHKDGKCFMHSNGQEREGGFGYWGECPQTASTTATAAHHARRPASRTNQTAQ